MTEDLHTVERERIRALMAPFWESAVGDGGFEARMHVVQLAQLVVREAQRFQAEQIAAVERAGGFTEHGERD